MGDPHGPLRNPMTRHRTIIRLSAVLAGVALAWSCGGDDSPTVPPTPEPARPTTVTVAPATPELAALGATVQLRAAVRDQSSAVMAGATVTWTSSASSVATVDASGLVTAAGNGTATITASAGSASGSAVVTVMQSAGSVVVSPAADTVAPGDTLRLAAEAFDENAHRVEGAEFGWSSSDVSVATVDASGLVTGVAEGTATVTAAAGDASGASEITVENPDRAALLTEAETEALFLGMRVFAADTMPTIISESPAGIVVECPLGGQVAVSGGAMIDRQRLAATPGNVSAFGNGRRAFSRARLAGRVWGRTPRPAARRSCSARAPCELARPGAARCGSAPPFPAPWFSRGLKRVRG